MQTGETCVHLREVRGGAVAGRGGGFCEGCTVHVVTDAKVGEVFLQRVNSVGEERRRRRRRWWRWTGEEEEEDEEGEGEEGGGGGGWEEEGERV